MRIKKLFPMPRQLTTYLVAIIGGAMITLGMYQVLPSQASTITATPETTLIAQRAPILNQRTSFVATAVNRMGAAVVRIDTEKTVSTRIDPFLEDPFFRRFFGDDFFSQIPTERKLQGQGSGFIIDGSGIILTNAHVVAQADKVTVSLKDGRTFEGNVLGADTVTDLAVVKVQGNNLPTVDLGNSEQIQVGDWAIAVGNPLGLDNTVTLGIISTLNRPSSQVGISDKRLDFIQTDAAINPGNSGGPLLNAQGEVIGINTAIRADATGIGFAIPINKAKEIYPQLEKGQNVEHPFLGIRMITLTPARAAEFNSDPNSPVQIPEVDGVLIMGIQRGTPAANSGLRRGDVITEIDGQRITSAEQLQRLVDDSRVGQTLKINVRRGGTTTTVNVRTGNLQDFSNR